jgi:hypothetical protein
MYLLLQRELHCRHHIEYGEAISVTGRGGSQRPETSRFPHFLDNRLTDSGKLVSLTGRERFTHQEYSWYSFLLEAK